MAVGVRQAPRAAVNFRFCAPPALYNDVRISIAYLKLIEFHVRLATGVHPYKKLIATEEEGTYYIVLRYTSHVNVSQSSDSS